MLSKLSVLFIFVLLATGCATKSQIVESSPEREGIRGAIKSQQREITGCWKEHLRHHPNDEGKLTLSWEVQPTGEAKEVKVVPEKSTLTNQIFQDCVIAQIQQTKFPPAPEGQEINIVYPFTFRRSVEFPYER